MSRDNGMRTVDAVLFDVDGTLVDSRDTIVRTYAHAVREVCGEEGARMWRSLDIEEILQLPAAEVFRRLAHGRSERAATLSAAFQRRYATILPDIPWFAGAVDALRSLHKHGVALGIVTTKARERLDLHLAAAGVAELFHATISGDETLCNKPDPAPLLTVLHRLGVPPERALMVGDGANDVLAAKRAGTGSVGVAYGFHPADCRAARPDHWITAIAQLPGLVTDTRR